VPEWKVETVGLSLFGVKVTKDGIVFSDSSIAAITDGGGRVASAMDELNETDLSGDTPVFVGRNILWQLNMDLSGDPLRSMQIFLLHNKWVKKTTRGTEMCVENAAIDLHGRYNGKMKFKSFSDPLAATYICNALYANYAIEGSYTSLLPWRIEGQRSESQHFTGKGTAQSIVTAISTTAGEWDRTGLKVQEAPDAIDFAFRYFFANSKEAVADARQAALKGISGDSRKGCQYHFHSTLAAKVMLYLAARIWPHTGPDTKKFGNLVEKVLWKHYQMYGRVGNGSFYNPTKGGYKKMSVGDFWVRSQHFATSNFNSGEGNTVTLMRTLSQACNYVLDDRPERK